MTLQIKLIIAAVLAALVGYSYIYTFNKGKEVGSAKCSIDSVEAMKKALKEQENKFNDQREAEMREAAETAKTLNKNNIRLAKDNQKLHDLLKQEKNRAFAATAVPDDVVIVLNGSRGSASPNT